MLQQPLLKSERQSSAYYRIFSFLFLCLICTPAAQAEIKIFELEAPQAKQVFLSGEMTHWDTQKIAMSKNKQGKWQTSVDLGPGQWLYKFIVDGQWITDPATSLNDADGMGGRHSFLFAGEGDWNEQSGIPHGAIHELMFASKAWGKEMKLIIYLPPGFKKGDKYPVLLLLHGQGMDADQWLKTGKINVYMDNLIAKQAIKPFVVVMPSSESVIYINQSERFLTEELPPWLHKEYGLKPDRNHFAVAGASMGGFGAFHLPSQHPNQFGFGFALSGYFPEFYINKLPARNPLPFKLMLLCGSEDSLLNANRKLAQVLKVQGAEFYYRENVGAHTWNYWSLHTSEMLTAVDTFFTGGKLPHNEADVQLEVTPPVALDSSNSEEKTITLDESLVPSLLGLWKGEWLLEDAGISGRYEETLTKISATSSEGYYSVYDAGTNTKSNEPFHSQTKVIDGHNYSVIDGKDIEIIYTQKGNELWRSWRVVADGQKVLVRVRKVVESAKQN